MLGDARRDARHRAVGRQRDPCDLFVVILDEPYVFHQCAEILPAWKAAGVNHEATQLAMRLDPRVGRERDGVEVLGSQSLADVDDQHAGLRNDALDHGRAVGERPQPLDSSGSIRQAEHFDRAGHHERRQTGRLADPADIGHDGDRLE
jgi:hypothetical protein